MNTWINLDRSGQVRPDQPINQQTNKNPAFFHLFKIPE